MDDCINRAFAIKLISDFLTPATDGYEEFLRDEICGNLLGKIPAANVVEVVRCKDCGHLVGYEWCPVWNCVPNDDDFCSRGERRQDGRPD